MTGDVVAREVGGGEDGPLPASLHATELVVVRSLRGVDGDFDPADGVLGNPLRRCAIHEEAVRNHVDPDAILLEDVHEVVELFAEQQRLAAGKRHAEEVFGYALREVRPALRRHDRLAAAGIVVALLAFQIAFAGEFEVEHGRECRGVQVLFFRLHLGHPPQDRRSCLSLLLYITAPLEPFWQILENFFEKHPKTFQSQEWSSSARAALRTSRAKPRTYDRSHSRAFCPS